MNIAEAIPDGATVLIDTNPLIYWFDGSEPAVPFESVFADVQAWHDGGPPRRQGWVNAEGQLGMGAATPSVRRR